MQSTAHFSSRRSARGERLCPAFVCVSVYRSMCLCVCVQSPVKAETIISPLFKLLMFQQTIMLSHVITGLCTVRLMERLSAGSKLAELA